MEDEAHIGSGLPEATALVPPDVTNTAADAAKAEEENTVKQEVQDTDGVAAADDDRGREQRRSKSRSHSRSPRHRSRSRSRSRDRRRRSRSRSRERERQRRARRSSRSPPRRRSRSRSRDRRRRQRSRSRDRGEYRRGGYNRGYSRRGDSDDDDNYGYRPRRRRGSSNERLRMATVEDPFAKLRSAAAANASADPATIARQMQEQQLRSRQLVLQQQAASAVAAASKTQREVYVGNLTPGVVNDAMLRQLFNATLQAAFPDRCAGGTIEPVLRINMAQEGKYCFIELLSSEMASACLALTGQVMLAGNMLSIGRPAGYVDPIKAQTAAQVAAEALARFQAESQAARREAGIAEVLEESPFVCIDGMVTADVLANDADYEEVVSDVRDEFEKHGTVLRVAVPRPDPSGSAAEIIGSGPYGKVYVQYLEAAGAQKAKAEVGGRMFSGQTVVVEHMAAEEFMEAVGQKAAA